METLSLRTRALQPVDFEATTYDREQLDEMFFILQAKHFTAYGETRLEFLQYVAKKMGINVDAQATQRR